MTAGATNTPTSSLKGAIIHVLFTRVARSRWTRRWRHSSQVSSARFTASSASFVCSDTLRFVLAIMGHPKFARVHVLYFVYCRVCVLNGADLSVDSDVIFRHIRRELTAFHSELGVMDDNPTGWSVHLL